MKVKAPFEVVMVASSDPCQVTQSVWHIAGLGLNRLRVYSQYPRTKVATQWGYWKQSRLGVMLLSIPYKWEWQREPVRENKGRA